MKSLSKFNNRLVWDKAICSIYGVANKHKSIRHCVRVNPDVIDINRFFIFKAATPPTMKSFYYNSIYKYNKKLLRKVHYVKKQKPMITIRGASK